MSIWIKQKATTAIDFILSVEKFVFVYVYIQVGSCWNERRVNDCCDMSMENMQTNQFDYRSNEIMWKSCFTYKNGRCADVCMRSNVTRKSNEFLSTLSLPLAHSHIQRTHTYTLIRLPLLCVWVYTTTTQHTHTTHWKVNKWSFYHQNITHSVVICHWFDIYSICMKSTRVEKARWAYAWRTYTQYDNMLTCRI